MTFQVVSKLLIRFQVLSKDFNFSYWIQGFSRISRTLYEPRITVIQYEQQLCNCLSQNTATLPWSSHVSGYRSDPQHCLKLSSSSPRRGKEHLWLEMFSRELVRVPCTVHARLTSNTRERAVDMIIFRICCKALNSLICADVPLGNYSHTQFEFEFSKV